MTPAGTKRRGSPLITHTTLVTHIFRTALPLVIEILPPLIIRVTDHAHDVAAGMQREGPRLTQQLNVADLVKQMIPLSAITGMAAGDKILPGRKPPARTGYHMVQGKLARRQNNPAVLAAVTVAKQDVLTRESTRLMWNAPVLKQPNHRRHRNPQQGGMQNGA